MFRGALLLILGWVLAANPAAASPAAFAPHSICHASSAPDEPFQRVAADPARWDCSGENWSIAGAATTVRWDKRGQHVAKDAVLTTRLTRFDRLTITAIGTNGTLASRSYGPDDVRFADDDWLMRADLPRLASPVAAIALTVEGARHRGVFSDARFDPPPSPWHVGTNELVMAALCGLLFVPLVLNFAFLRVLRQRFLLWHSAAVLFMLVQTLVSSGLVNRMASLTMLQISVLSAMSWALAIGSAAMFISDMIEPDMLDGVHRRLMRALMPWIIAWTMVYLFADGPFRPYAAQAYYAAFLPVLGILGWSMLTAAARGSRAVLFQIAAWAPLMLTGLVRVVSSLLGTPLELMLEQHLSIGFEVVVTSLGAVERFMSIRRQRDQAVAQSKLLETLAQRDSLTGIYNRRAIEERFDDLCADGFDTMAVIDLDHFKEVNDTRGHACGDSVLQTVAHALMPDDDTIAVRLGGEEFLLLLRGPHSAERAERRRQAIPVRIATDMPGLDRMVTASMGLVLRRGGSDMAPSFREMYADCDRLLYEAKAAGRNCTRSETIRTFARPAHLAVGYG